MDMKEVLQLLDADLGRVELQFQENLRSDVTLIPTVGRYVLASGGKRIRPLLVLLAARLCGYRGDRAVPLASIVEFIHTATLLHDDVVDNADLRRGQESANAVWGNEASVLVGDFLFSKSFSLLVADGDIRILRVMSGATTCMAEGEVLELLKTCDLETREDEYLEVVTNKTAVLIAAACEVGALLGEADPARTAALRDYGMHVGVAFQLMDDCLDYVGDRDEFGKTVGTDLEEGKVTLPLIHALKSADEAERRLVQSVIEKEALDAGDLERIRGLIERYGGIERTRAEAAARIEQACRRLSSFAPCTERDALEVVARYVLTRSR